MRRASPQRLVVLGVLLLGLQLGSGSTLLASPTGRASALTADERATLLRYARDTWRSFERLALPSGLPADSLSRDGEGWSNPLMQTSPTNIAAYLWSILAAERLHLIGAAGSQVAARPDPRDAGGHGPDPRASSSTMLDPRTGAALKVSPFDSSPVRHSPLRGGQRLAGRRADDGRQHRAVAAGPRREAPRADGFPLLLRPLRRRPIPSAIRASFAWATGRTTIRSTATTGCSTRRPASPATSASPAASSPPNTTTGCSGPCPRTWGRSSSRPAARPASTTGSRSSRALTIIGAYGSSRAGAGACSRP